MSIAGCAEIRCYIRHTHSYLLSNSASHPAWLQSLCMCVSTNSAGSKTALMMTLQSCWKTHKSNSDTCKGARFNSNPYDYSQCVIYKEQSDFPFILHKHTHTSVILPNHVHVQSREDEQQNKGLLRTDNNDIFYPLPTVALHYQSFLPHTQTHTRTHTHTLAIYVRLCERMCVELFKIFVSSEVNNSLFCAVPRRVDTPEQRADHWERFGYRPDIALTLNVWMCVCVCIYVCFCTIRRCHLGRPSLFLSLYVRDFLSETYLKTQLYLTTQGWFCTFLAWHK